MIVLGICITVEERQMCTYIEMGKSYVYSWGGGLLRQRGWNIEIYYGVPPGDVYLWHVVTGCKF